MNNEIVNNIDTNIEGEYIITYKATNNGKEASVTRKVVVLEMKPVITMTEPDSNYVKEQEVLITVSGIKPNKVERFSYQIGDGEIINVTGTSTKITLNETGEQTVKVIVEDNNGHRNTMSKLYRIDSTGPVITVNPKTVELESSEVGNYDVLTGITVIDNIDGTIDNSKIVVSKDTLKEAPGEYEIIYTVEDSLGNSSRETRTIIVKDLTGPIIVLTPNGTEGYVKEQSIKIEVTDKSGVESISYVIIKDGERGNSNTINSGESIRVNETGNYEIEVIARDTLGNEETKLSETYYIDHTEPEILFEDVTLKLDEVTGYDLMTGVSVRDNVSSEEKIKVTYTGGLSATIGTQTIIYEAEDEAGNKSTKVRTFRVTDAEKPIVSFTPIETTGWVKEVNVTIKATVKIGENLTSLVYSINNGTEKNGTVTNNEGTASITLNTTGTYRISARATGSYNNTKEETSGEYKIDRDLPIVGEIGGNTSSWTTSKTLTSTLTDNHSGVRYYAVTTSNSTPTNWTSVGESAVSSYALSYSVTTNGTYYIWAKDGAGNISTSKSVTVNKIDTIKPTITSSYTSTAYSMTEKTNVAVSTLYSASFGGMGGSVTCKNGTTTITNLNTLAVGTHTLTCIATGNNGKTSSVSPKVTIKPNSAGEELKEKDNLPLLADLYRYRGANPNNWVCFGNSGITNPSNCDANHKWRIIGIDKNGRMKIMTNYYYSESKAWDTTNSSDWGKPVRLNTELNGSSFYSNNTYIDATHRGYIINATWYTGGQSPGGTFTLQAFQTGEKSKSTTGYVGLMSMTDFGYAGSSCTLSTNMYSTNNACMSNNWIGYSNYQWSITPNGSDSSSVWDVDTGGSVSPSNVNYNRRGVCPSVYLDSTVRITGGTGTESNPYILSK